MTGIVMVVGGLVWGFLVLLLVVVVHGGTRDRSYGPRPEAPSIGEDLSEDEGREPPA